MEIAGTVLAQVIIMFLLIGVGILAYKLKMIDNPSNKKITDILLYIVAPAVIVTAFSMEYDENKLRNLGIAFLLGIGSTIIGITVSMLLIRKKNNPEYYLERFAAVYSNAGFMALPLAGAVFGAEGIFYASAYMIVFQVFCWSHGVLQISGKFDRKAVLKTLYSPCIIAVVIGLILYLTQFKLPDVVNQTLNYVASLNTPLAMISIGCTLAQSPIKDAFCKLRNYYPVLLRNLLIPILAVTIYALIPGLDNRLILINILSTACPSAAIIVMFAQKFDKNTAKASQMLTLSNVVSLMSVPVVMFFAQKIVTLF